MRTSGCSRTRCSEGSRRPSSAFRRSEGDAGRCGSSVARLPAASNLSSTTCVADQPDGQTPHEAGHAPARVVTVSGSSELARDSCDGVSKHVYSRDSTASSHVTSGSS